MSFLVQENIGRWYRLTWWLCIITLPWIDMANNISLILLTLIWIAEGNFKSKSLVLKSSIWVWSFLIYYSLLVIGVFYTQDLGNGLFALEKKISFLVLPLIASTGLPFDAKFVSLLKRSFVYSCCAVIIFCLAAGAFNFLNGGISSNFDFSTNDNFSAIHPEASPVWMHFSYIQLAHWAGVHPGYLSMYLVFCLIILNSEEFQNNRERSIHIPLAIFIVAFIGLLATRMAIIAFACSAAFISIRNIQKKQIKSVMLMACNFLILLLILWYNPVARFRVMEEPRITIYQADRTVTNWNSVSYRLLEWEGSWSVVKASWFGGVGTGGGKLAMGNFYSHYNSSTVGLTDNAHDQYLQTWMENGLIGLLAFLLCLFAGLPQLHKDVSYVSFILIFSLMCLTESIGERQKGIVFFTSFQVLFLGYVNRKE